MGNNVNLAKLPVLFKKVEQNYNNTHKTKVTVDKDISTTGMVFGHLGDYKILELGYRTHKENKLMEDVRKLSSIKAKSGKKVEPQDIYKISLELNKGDRIKALITAQDALKMTGWAREIGSVYDDKVGIEKLVGEKFFNNYVKKHGGEFNESMADKMGEAYLASVLTPIKDNKDFAGKYYHLFGTAAAGSTGKFGETATNIYGKILVPIREFFGLNKSNNKNTYTKEKLPCDEAGLAISKELNK